MENNRLRIPLIHHLRTPPTRTGHPRGHHDPRPPARPKAVTCILSPSGPFR